METVNTNVLVLVLTRPGIIEPDLNVLKAAVSQIKNVAYSRRRTSRILLKKGLNQFFLNNIYPSIEQVAKQTNATQACY